MKRVIEVRRAGMAYIAASIFFGVIAVSSTNNLLYLATAALLGYMLASGIAGRRNILNASASVSFPDEIYAQVPCAVSVRVANRSRFVPIFLIEATININIPNGNALEGGPQRRSLFFPVIQPGRTEAKTLFVTFRERGRQTAADVELSSVYPFNFFVRYWPSGLDDAARSVTVFPCPLKCDPEFVFIRERHSDRGRDGGRERGLSDAAGVRPYAEGDSMRRIHWKSSARTGKLKTRLYDETSSRTRLLIDLDRLVAGGGRRRRRCDKTPLGLNSNAWDAERGLSAAAYAIAESMKTGAPIGMICRREFIPPAAGRAHKMDLLTRLALYHE
jgi:uncharacterized protein (DUF58 family)